MNFFYRLPLLTTSLFLLSSAQSSGDSTCRLEEICQSRHLDAFHHIIKTKMEEFYENVGRQPSYNIFLDYFMEKKTSLPNLDYISCLVNNCDDHISVAQFLSKTSIKSPYSVRPQKQIRVEVLELMNIVMTQKQRERFETSLNETRNHVTAYFRRLQEGVRGTIGHYFEFLNGWKNGFGILDNRSFNNQNEKLFQMVSHIMRKQNGEYEKISETKRGSFVDKLKDECSRQSYGSSLSRKIRDNPRNGPTKWEKDLQNFFKVNFRHCESRSASCTLENRIKAAVVKYMLESCQGLNQVFYRNVCPESP